MLRQAVVRQRQHVERTEDRHPRIRWHQGGNPTVIVNPATGRIVLLSVYQCVKSPECGRKPRVQHSDDNGLTWQHSDDNGLMSFSSGVCGVGSIIYSDDQGVTWHRGATDVSTMAHAEPAGNQRRRTHRRPGVRGGAQ
jgi:hypothetical protein